MQLDLQAIRNQLGRNSQLVMPLLFLVGVSIAEYLTAAVQPLLGVVMHALLLCMILIAGALVNDEKQRRLLWTLTIGPLIRILSLTLPLLGFPVLSWYAIISVPVFAATFTIARTVGYTARDLGLVPEPLKLLRSLVVVPVGFALGFVEYAILQPAPLATGISLEELWLPIFVLTVSTGFEEELIFRGLLQRSATDALGSSVGLYFVSALFASLHIGYLSITDLLFVFVVGHSFALVARSSGSIWAPTLAHGAVNSCLFLVAPFLLNPPT